ncbi:hypothetical protein [Silvibacterium acidisoli]|uniref:hypothetical protein n=1 Tax=Acidobacteriaceae bacterium ZG23-2 TaxID=2883246 RepID=UPI00406CFCF9
MRIGSTAAVAALVCSLAMQAQQPATTQQNSSPDHQQAAPHGKVLFSRSEDDTQQNVANAEDAKASENPVKDAQRDAVTFTEYNLDVHLSPRDHTIAVRARLEVRNDSSEPMALLPVQISSSLNFEGISAAGKRLNFERHAINSDVDHTGQLHEAEVTLPEPLAPGAKTQLEVVYSGRIDQDGRRLLQMGTPDEIAGRSDWDRISEDFTGVRGFGNVVWYPVSSVPAILGDGAKVFNEIGAQKLREQGASFSVRLTVEYLGEPPAAAFLDGRQVAMEKPTLTPGTDYPGVISCSLPAGEMGFEAPSLFLVSGAPITGGGEVHDIQIYAREADRTNAQGLLTAATMVRPLVQQWLGKKNDAVLSILDLPEAEDASYQEGNLLLTGVTADAPEKMTSMVASALSHAYFQSRRAWLREGVATYMGTLWTEQSHDRNTALERLEAQRSSLAFAEPGTPGAGPGQDLIHASDAVYYQTKAAYVFWMLRDLAGEKELAAALTAYRAEDDTTQEYFEHLVEKSSGKDLKWFFDNWVYRDRGLPDLSIAGVYLSPGGRVGETFVAVDIANDGFAEAEVPVTVHTRENSLTERVRLPGKTRTVHRMLIQGQPDEVIVNDGAVPEIAATVHRRTIINQ